MNSNYKQRYDRFKPQVDAQMGRPLGKWGRFKAFFAPNSLTPQRKQAVHQAEQNLRAANPEAWLYHPNHVIGTTSAAGQQPTVYYRTRSGTFGHITQEHAPTNVGREPARTHPAYTFGNIPTAHGPALVERIPGALHHQSRNPLRPVTTTPQRAAASTAHVNFPDIKQRVLVTGSELGPQFGALPRGVHTQAHW